MRKNNRLNILLVEIVIATLFFALASTVILKVYASTRRQSVMASIDNIVQAEVQNLSEECYAAEDVAAVLTAHGFNESESKYVYDGEDYSITAEIENEETETGILRTVVFNVEAMGEERLSVPTVRYIPEVAEQ